MAINVELTVCDSVPQGTLLVNPKMYVRTRDVCVEALPDGGARVSVVGYAPVVLADVVLVGIDVRP